MEHNVELRSNVGKVGRVEVGNQNLDSSFSIEVVGSFGVPDNCSYIVILEREDVMEDLAAYETCCT
jgi:hypothetical protein